METSKHMSMVVMTRNYERGDEQFIKHLFNKQMYK